MADRKTAIVNNPAAPEVYADRVASVSLRGPMARISFASDRSGSDPKAPESVVSGHVAMPVRGFLQLYAQMQSVVNQMQQSGMLKSPEAPEKERKSAPRKPAAKKKTAAAKARK